MTTMPLRLTTCALAALWLAGCASTPDTYGNHGNALPPMDTNIDLSSIPPAIPHPEPLSEYGNPISYTVFGETYYPMTEAEARGFSQTGMASWYGREFHGERTSSGETYNMYRMTAAHKTLPLPSYVRVTNLRNGEQVIVRVNDRGPFHEGRIIDLSYVAALKLGMAREGSAPVRIELVTAEEVSRPGAAARTVSYMPSGPAHRRTASAAAAAPAAVVSRLYLQAGAFASHANARRMANRLRRMGINSVRITPTRESGTTLYRVRAGPFSDPARRRTVGRRLTLHGIPVIPVRQHAVR